MFSQLSDTCSSKMKAMVEKVSMDTLWKSCTREYLLVQLRQTAIRDMRDLFTTRLQVPLPEVHKYIIIIPSTITTTCQEWITPSSLRPEVSWKTKRSTLLGHTLSAEVKRPPSVASDRRGPARKGAPKSWKISSITRWVTFIYAVAHSMYCRCC